MPYINNNIINIPLFEGYCRKNDIDGKEITASISGCPVDLKVAATDRSKSIGYMDQDEPVDNKGMLFVYDDDEILNFWMKGVDFPLDIIFFDVNMDLVNHLTMNGQSGETDEDLDIYKSEKPARFAVELRKGWCEDNIKDNNCKIHF